MRLAARGLRDLDHGPEPIADRTELAQVRRQARMVYIKSLIAAAALTALAYVV
ncbi:MAG TPA: hypothetical protein VIV83_06165 [Gemmatimonadales bacterium]